MDIKSTAIQMSSSADTKRSMPVVEEISPNDMVVTISSLAPPLPPPNEEEKRREQASDKVTDGKSKDTHRQRKKGKRKTKRRSQDGGDEKPLLPPSTPSDDASDGDQHMVVSLSPERSCDPSRDSSLAGRSSVGVGRGDVAVVGITHRISSSSTSELSSNSETNVGGVLSRESLPAQDRVTPISH